MKSVLELLDAPRDRIPILWSAAHREGLGRIATGEIAPRAIVDPPLSRCLLKCAAGLFTEAEDEILGLLREGVALCETDAEIFASFTEAVFTVQRFDLLAAMLRDRLGYPIEFELGVRRDGPGLHCVRWDILPSARHRFTFDATAYENDKTRIINLLFQWIFPLCAHYAQQPDQERGSVVINLGDIGGMPGLAFCDNRPDRFLVPDTVFVPTQGYSAARQTYKADHVPWDQRQPIAFWRGTTTGIARGPGDWRSLERIKLCELARRGGLIGLIDAGISDIAQFDDPTVVQEITESGLFRGFVPWQTWNRYKYHIDIDGNANAWSAFFYRLLTGSPVLKVESSRGLMQWFYDRLVPWGNYVPVAPDMSDLVDKITWLGHHPATAQQIGQHGRELAEAMTYEREVKRAMPVISAAFRYFAGRGDGDRTLWPGLTGFSWVQRRAQPRGPRRGHPARCRGRTGAAAPA